MDAGRNDPPEDSWSLFRTPAFCGPAGPEESAAPIQVLGPLRVLAADGTELPLGSLTQRAILAHLLVHTNQVVATSALVESVWRGHPPTTARKIVQNAMSRLRRLLAEARRDDDREVLLLTRSPGYQLIIQPSTLDICRFQGLTVAGREALAAGNPDEAARCWRRAISLWRGPALADLAKDGICRPELDTLHNWRLDLLEDLFDVELAGGRHEPVLTELQVTARAYPHRERLQALLMLALHRCGRSTDALRISDDAHDRGHDVGPALRDTARAIRSGAAAVPQPRRSAEIPAVPAVAAHPAPDSAQRRQLTVVLVKAVTDGDPADAAEPPDQEDVDLALSRVDAVLRQEVRHAGGHVAAQVGSLWLAVFGLRPDFGDPAHRAVLAAFAIRHGCAELGRHDRPGDPGGPASVRIAVATGEMLVRTAPGGPPVVSGAALERGHATVTGGPPMVIRVDAETRAGTERRLDYQPGPDGTFTALGVPAAVPSAAVPLVGRETELRLLTDLVAGAGRPHVVTVVGEPGSGKTRLAEELARVVAAQRDAEAPLLVSAPTVLDRTAPVLLAAGIRACCGVSRWDAPELAQGKLRRLLGRAAQGEPERSWLAARLGPLVAAADREPDWTEVSDDLLAAWWRLVERVATIRPTVVVVDDLDRAYRTLGDRIAALTTDADAPPLLVVATSEVPPSLRWPDWGRDPARTTLLRLPPLAEPDTARLVTRLLADHGVALTAPPATATVEALVPLAQGVPLRAEQYCGQVRDALGTAPDRAYGCLLSVDAAVRLLPRSVRLGALGRLEELPPEARSVARSAAAVGDVLWAGAVAAVHGRPVETELGALLDAGVLVKDGAGLIADDTQFAFADAATRHVAYAMIPRAQRTQAHTRAARWLDGLPGPGASAVLTRYRDQLVRLSAATGHSFDEILLRAAERLSPIVSGDALGAVPDLARYHLVLATTATRYPVELNSLVRHWHAWQLTHRQVLRRPAYSPATGDPVPPAPHLTRTAP